MARLLDGEATVAAVGVNSVPLELVTPALAALGTATSKPLVAYPNSGETYHPGTKTWGPAAPSESKGESSRRILPRAVRPGRTSVPASSAGAAGQTPGDIAAVALA